MDRGNTKSEIINNASEDENYRYQLKVSRNLRNIGLGSMVVGLGIDIHEVVAIMLSNPARLTIGTIGLVGGFAPALHEQANIRRQLNEGILPRQEWQSEV